MVGTNSKRCKEDERMINTVLGYGKRGYIIETRNQNLAQLARNRGGGFELEMYYPLWKRVHKPIDRHSSLLDSLSKLVEGLFIFIDTIAPNENIYIFYSMQ